MTAAAGVDSLFFLFVSKNFQFTCGAAEATGLGFILLLSTLVCCQPTELILGFFCFINFPMLHPQTSFQVSH